MNEAGPTDHATLMSPRARLAIALAGLDGELRASGVRSMLNWAGGLGFEAVAIDASHPETRPRSMDRSARRDLAAAMRRAEVASAGVELWLPAAHLDDPNKADHAVGALLAALELAADLAALTQGQPCLVTAVRTGRDGAISPGASEALGLLTARAGAIGAEIGEAGWPAVVSDAASPLGVALDPAAIISQGDDPVSALGRLHSDGLLRSVRLNDLGRTGRVPVGSQAGRLDAEALVFSAAALNLRQFMVLDLAGIDAEQQSAAASFAAERFGRRARE